MKYLWLLAPVALYSCSQSEHPVATPKPTKALARVSGKPYSELKRGYGVYLKHCAECHEHRLPNTVTLPEWHAQIDAMAEVAGLPPEDEESLQIYLGEFSDR
jgi:hypothetical protein